MDGWNDIKPQLQKLTSNGTVIDVAAGTGRSATLLSKEGYEVTLHDICHNCFEPQSTALAKEMLICPVTNLMEVPPRDAATCIDFLEHVPEEIMDEVLAAISNVGRWGAVVGVSALRDNGMLHVTVKTADWWKEKLARHWAKVAACEVSVSTPGQNPLNWFLFRCEHDHD